MPDLVCNGHNPCGDNSDCQLPEPTIEVATAKAPNQMIVIILVSLAATCVFLVVAAVVTLKCYRRRQKHTREHQVCIL